MKVRPLGVELFQTDGRTGERTDGQMDRHDEANSRLSKFCEGTYKFVIF